jgi:hypothetical protein
MKKIKVKIINPNSKLRLVLKKFLDRLLIIIVDLRINKFFWIQQNFEVFLNPENITYLSMQINWEMTANEVFIKIHNMTRILLSKRQCYKLIDIAKKTKNWRK